MLPETTVGCSGDLEDTTRVAVTEKVGGCHGASWARPSQHGAGQRVVIGPARAGWLEEPGAGGSAVARSPNYQTPDSSCRRPTSRVHQRLLLVR
uniref:Uncharacterized protein n=1 Tax=Arundo donax TaxID=35708 RepID=A0A0A8YE10_ARUDO